MRVAGVVLALIAFLVVGCGAETTAEEPAPATETSAVAGAAPRGERPVAPSIAGTTLDGVEISLADFRGEPVFVNVWSSW